MTFDVNKFMEQAKTEHEKQQKFSDSREYPYKVVFVKPDNSSVLQVRLLPNNVSNQIAYKYWHHDIPNQGRHMCGYDYYPNSNCPICEAINEVKNATGANPKGGAVGRSIVLAQYVGSQGYVWDNDRVEPQLGEIIIVMGPLSMYDNIINMTVTQGPEGVVKILTDYKGAVININRDKNARSVQVTPTFGVFESAPTQGQFDQMCDALPDIRYIVHEKDLSQEEYAKLVELANGIRKQYMTNTSQQQIQQPFTPGSESVAQAVQAASLGVPTGVVPVINPQPTQVVQPVQPAAPVQPVQSQQSVQSTAPVQPVTPVTNPAIQQPITQSVQQPVVQSVPSQQSVTPVNQVGQPPVQSVLPQQSVASVQSSQQIPTYNNDGIPSDCPQSYNALSNSCLLCIKSPSCPFNK